ncbi:glycosyltransferase family 4 protein [Clostridium sardiniense]|uniref:glycosyltransferase family 4 protein n=1 Tax=Clostridium sardiniense TaxID=29369 RepID=UPI00195ABCFA|nr:glycosyltransferase family 1 protein [Clostridium sardiniense]MBM7833062.1 glycosyltransferase involved in cell wall biosynthesis [Clostridium sardiniense]
MKILLDLTSLNDNFSGIERFTLNISKSLIINDFKNEYILIFKNEIYKEFKDIINKNNVKVKVIKGKNKLITTQIILPLKLYKIKADKYIFLAFPAPVLFFRKGIVNAIHDMTAWLFPETMSKKGLILFKLLIRKALINSERIVTVSQSSKRDINKIFNKNNIPIDIIFNGIDEKFIDFKFDLDRANEVSKKYNLNFKYILCLGTIEPRKNVMLLIDSYIELKKEYGINFKLVLVGRKGWKYNNIINKIKENNLEEDIIFTGFVDDEDLPYVYNMAELFVFPSIYEGFGIPIIEAMSVGVPVIGANTSSIPEVLEGNGILFENNKESLKLKIMKLLNMNDEDKKGIISNGYIRAKDFSWKEEANKLLRNLER